MSQALRKHHSSARNNAQLSFLESAPDALLMHTIISLPKVDLHRHLTGSIGAAMAVRIGAKYGVELPSYVAAELEQTLFAQEAVDNHKQYFFPWPVLNRLFVTLDAVRELLTEVVRDAASDNVVYTELRLGPRNFLGDSSDYTFEEFVEVVADTLRDANIKYNTVTKCILGIPRHVFTRVPKDARNRMFAKMLYTVKRRPDCFVGVDLNGDELTAHGSDFLTFFKIARDLDLPATVHAGEIGSAESVSFAVNQLHASRIGHGIAAAHSIETLSLLADKRCTLEICPTSNKFLNVIHDYIELPLRKLQEYNVPFVICTDNPARCRTTLSEELYKIAKSFSYSVEDISGLTRASLNASFADENTKRIVASRFN